MSTDQTFPQIPLQKQCHRALQQYHTFTDVQYNASTKLAREFLVRLSRCTQRAIPEDITTSTALPPEIWLQILGDLGDDSCIYCKHNILRILALVCRFFSIFASKGLYETLDLRFNGSETFLRARNPCPTHPNKEYYPPAMKLIRTKLDKLHRTLRAQPEPRSRIRHLKLPENISVDKSCSLGPIYEAKRHGCILTDMHIKWIRIFKLSSSRLETVSGLGSLWAHLHSHKRLELQNDLWIAMRNNHHWTHWDFTAWYISEFEATDLRELILKKLGQDWSDPRLLDTFRGWKYLRHISLASTAWSQGALGLLQRLESLVIQTDQFLDFEFAYRYIPVNKLKSFRVRNDLSEYQWTSPISEPFNPLISYLRDCQLKASLSSPFMLSTLTTLEISHEWSDKVHTIPGLPSVEEFALAVFTLVPLLQALTIEITTFHERIIEPSDAFSRNSPTWPIDFVVSHLRKMVISIPARNNKEWLATKIDSGAFPNLSTFVFRSGLSRRRGVSLCDCVPCFREAFGLYEFAKEQDTMLVKACRKAGIPNWEMLIPDRPRISCFVFTLDDTGCLEDSEALYRRELAYVK